MTDQTKKPRRQRRTKVAVERDVFEAVESLIEEVGFANVTLTAVAQRARIEASVFYRRYDNMEELFDEYTRKYDYWLGGLAELMPSNLSDQDAMKWIMSNLIRALYKNKGMQQLLVWELVDSNPVTRRTATLREKVNETLIKLLESRFKGTDLDINVIVGVLISGIYYLILHRKISKFCEVEYDSREGKLRLTRAIDQIVSMIFAEVERQTGTPA